MGNKATSGSHGMKNNLQVHLSEEDYMPMPLTMRRMLVDGKRFKHVLPSRHSVVQVVEEEKQSVKDSVTSAEEEVHELVYDNEEPVVTLMSVHSEIRRPQDLAEWQGSQIEEKTPCSQTPVVRNRQCSDTDLQTGLTKSRFTLQLEERMRQSKLELGFDVDLEDWKEFSFKMGKPEEKRRTESVGKANVFSRQGSNVGSVKVEPLEYCAHNCQILGLCGVKKPDVFQSYEPSVFKEEINRKYNIKHLLKSEAKHEKRDECNCDLCTLAYLTDMGFPEYEDRRAVVTIDKTKKPSRCSRSNRCGDSDTPLEEIKIIDNGNMCKSIEVSVPDRQSSPESVRRTVNVSSSRSLISMETAQEDCTNLKIKKMFEKNMIGPKIPTVTDRYKNSTIKLYNDVSIVNLSTSEPEYGTADSASHRSRTPSDHADARRSRVTKRRSAFNGGGKQSSSSTLDTSSSLSTVLSYQRVRQIFLTFIEKNRSRRRTRRDVRKFREMEELGLGHLRNNRWYPSDSKTFTIWNNMQSNVRGFQAQFKKYPKTVSKP